MGESNRVRVSYEKEATWGDAPGGDLQIIRRTGGRFGRPTESTESEEVRSDRQVTNLIRTATSAEGDLQFEFSYGTFDALLEGALFGSWQAAVSISGSDISVDATAEEFQSTTTDLSGATAGAIIETSGFANDANNGFFLVESSGANSIKVDSNWASGLVDEAEGPSIDIEQGAYLRNGTEMSSYTFEEYFEDLDLYLAFHGMVVDSVDMAIAPGQITTGAFNFQGKDGDNPADTVGSGTYLEETTEEVLNAVDHVNSVRVAGQVTNLDLTQLDISIANNLRSRNAIGSLGAAAIKPGRVGVTGQLSAYLEDNTLITRYMDWQSLDIHYELRDVDGNGLWVSVPTAKLTGDLPDPGGLDSDVLDEQPFTAYRDPVYGYTVQVARFPVA